MNRRLVAKVLSASRAAVVSFRSWRHASGRGLAGLDFAMFARRLAVPLVPHAPADAVRLLITPINCVRYFEFSFAWAHTPYRVGRYLDVSSPRIFPLRMAAEGRAAHIVVANPDRTDLNFTRTLAETNKIHGIEYRADVAGELDMEPESFDLITCLSVVEHIADENGDSDAVSHLYDLLRPGGRLIVTLPVDRAYRVDYRDRPQYEVSAAAVEDSRYLFERVYDERAIRERILGVVEGATCSSEFYGERSPGLLGKYFTRWLADGDTATADDARLMVDEVTRWPSWSAMPGAGVCCMCIDKPLEQRS
jgi:SAM-dependent methyltransferase